MTSFLTLLLACAPAAHAVAWDARITSVDGADAYVYTQGGDEGLPAQVDMPLEPGDRVETGKGSRVEVALDADSVFELGANTSFTIDEHGDDDGTWITGLTLSLGSLVAKLKSLGERRALEVRTPTAVAAVRGTEFGVEVEAGGETAVGVFDEGRVGVLVREDPGIAETVLTPGQEAAVSGARKQKVVERDGRRFLRARGLKRHKARAKRLDHLRARRQDIGRRWRALGERRGELRRRMRQSAGKLDAEQRRRIREFRSKRGARLDKRRAKLQRRLQQVRQRHGTMRERMRRHRRGMREQRQERRQNRRENLRERRQERRDGMRERGGEPRENFRERRRERRDGGMRRPQDAPKRNMRGPDERGDRQRRRAAPRGGGRRR